MLTRDVPKLFQMLKILCLWNASPCLHVLTDETLPDMPVKFGYTKECAAPSVDISVRKMKANTMDLFPETSGAEQRALLHALGSVIGIGHNLEVTGVEDLSLAQRVKYWTSPSPEWERVVNYDRLQMGLQALVNHRSCLRLWRAR